jgi:hypothetical protein
MNIENLKQFFFAGKCFSKDCNIKMFQFFCIKKWCMDKMCQIHNVPGEKRGGGGQYGQARKTVILDQMYLKINCANLAKKRHIILNKKRNGRVGHNVRDDEPVECT